MAVKNKYPWLWDVDMDSETFDRVLSGRVSSAGLDWKWAMARLIDYASFKDIRRFLPRSLFVEHWRDVAPLVRSSMRREGMDYLYQRLIEQAKAV